ncbi:unnamed protein product [Rotaria sordida]|uniref:Fumarate lyase N-terminal domain-containing protein n=2 Tax=Rotaria sordida TaxID=392033 RepID=A0A815NR35_9BILA|nr:unnamed protein product [Rotaria sordida]
MINTGTGARPPWSCTRDVACSPIYFGSSIKLTSNEDFRHSSITDVLNLGIFFHTDLCAILPFNDKNVFLNSYKIPLPVIKALALFRQACAMVNSQFGLDQHISNAIVQVCNEILKEGLNDQFPLSAFQPGSGIHANMNINEIIANRAMEIVDGMEVGVGV